MRIYCREERVTSSIDSLCILAKSEKQLPELAKTHKKAAGLVYLDPPKYRAEGAVKGKKDGALTESEFLKLLRPVLAAAYKLLSPAGTLVLHLPAGSHARLRLLADEIFGEANFVNTLIWHYKTAKRTARCFPSAHDTLLVYRKSAAQYTDLAAVAAQRTAERTNHWKKTVDESGRIGYSTTINGKTHTVFEGDPLPLSDVWTDIDPVTSRHPEKTGLSGQKPLALLERLIKAYTRPGDLVVDPFLGSGTTAVAAARLGRRCIGMDCDPLALFYTRRRLLALNATPSLLAEENTCIRFTFPAMRTDCTVEAELIQKAGRSYALLHSALWDGQPASLLEVTSGTRTEDVFSPCYSASGGKYPLKVRLPEAKACVLKLTDSRGRYCFIQL